MMVAMDEVDAKSRFGWAPFINAANGDRTEVVNLLLDASSATWRSSFDGTA